MIKMIRCKKCESSFDVRLVVRKKQTACPLCGEPWQVPIPDGDEDYFLGIDGGRSDNA